MAKQVKGKAEKPAIVKDIVCRVGLDHFSSVLFINKLSRLDTEIAYLVCKELGIKASKLHDLTCLIIRDLEQEKKSIAGEPYLSKKVLRLKLRIIIEDCQLINDRMAKVPAPNGKKEKK